MKLLTAVITPARLSSVTGALEAAGFEPMMTASVQAPAQSRAGLRYRGVDYADHSVVRVELLVDGGDVERAVLVVCQANDTGAGAPEEVRLWTTDVQCPLGPVTRRPAPDRSRETVDVR